MNDTSSTVFMLKSYVVLFILIVSKSFLTLHLFILFKSNLCKIFWKFVLTIAAYKGFSKNNEKWLFSTVFIHLWSFYLSLSLSLHYFPLGWRHICRQSFHIRKHFSYSSIGTNIIYWYIADPRASFSK